MYPSRDFSLYNKHHMSYFLLIEIVGSILYLLQKIFLSSGKRVGWLLGFLGSISFAIVTFHKNSFSYSILEVTSGIIFLFGLFAWKKNESLQIKVTFLMSAITLAGIVIMFFMNFGSPNWILENAMVILFAIGAVFLVIKHPLGWILYLLGHLLLIFYAYGIGAYYIMALQIVSVPLAIRGYRNLSMLRIQ